jgi:hypothetical protein
MVLIDEHGIEPHKFTHIFVESKGGPGHYFAGGWEYAQLRPGSSQQVSLSGYQRVHIFPKSLPLPVVGTIFPEGVIPLDVETIRFAGKNDNIREFFLLDGVSDDLKPRDVITHPPDAIYGPAHSAPRYIQVTLIERVRVADLFGDDEKSFRLSALERALQKSLSDDDIVKRCEFVETYARKIGIHEN